jgi:hypothetical protein
MKRYLILVICVGLAMGIAMPVLAQQKSEKIVITPALEKELYAVDLRWMKAEADKKTSGPDSMGELWTDDFFDVLPGGKVVGKQEMMDMMVKSERKPGTGAFPDTFKIRAVYGNVVLATDHTIIKGVDAKGNIVPVLEMGVIRMFVRENGKWRVAGAGLVPIPPPSK